MTLIEIRCGRQVHDAIWTYNLCAQTLDKATWEKAEALLNNLLDDIINQQDTIWEPQVMQLFTKAVSSLKKLFDAAPHDDFGVYEYGGLNNLFADIMEALNFQVKKGERYLISNLVYGIDFEENL